MAKRKTPRPMSDREWAELMDKVGQLTRKLQNLDRPPTARELRALEKLHAVLVRLDAEVKAEAAPKLKVVGPD